MTAPVDVLLAIDELIAFEETSASGINRGAREARAAVAELVEAAKAMNALAKGPTGGVSQQQKREAIARVDAALAKFGGAK